jgi:hypothetical protein
MVRRGPWVRIPERAWSSGSEESARRTFVAESSVAGFDIAPDPLSVERWSRSF